MSMYWGLIKKIPGADVFDGPIVSLGTNWHWMREQRAWHCFDGGTI
jgi:hypothetical protein